MKYFFYKYDRIFLFLLSCFYFTNNLYLKFIHRLLQCSDAVQNLFPSSFPITVSRTKFFI